MASSPLNVVINAAIGGRIDLFKGSDDSIIAVVLDANGAPLDLTGSTVTLELYDRADRKNASALSLAGTLTAAAAGHVTFPVTDANSGTLTAGSTYYAFLKRDAGSTTYSFSKTYTTVNVK